MDVTPADVSPPKGLRRRTRVVLLGVGWVLLVLVTTIRLALSPGGMGHGSGSRDAWAFAARIAATDWGAWLVLFPVALVLVRRFPIGGRPWPRAVAVHVAAAFALGISQIGLHVAVDGALWAVLGRSFSPIEHAQWLAWRQLSLNVVIYALLAGVLHALHYRRASAQRELQAARLQSQLANARLNLLRAQLRPHFLYNALNSISALIGIDPRAADDALVRLGELLRLTLSVDTAKVQLRDDIALGRAYLDIERIRFGQRLSVRWDVPASLLGAEVPSMLLQPLLENAVQHGISTRAGPGHIDVHVRREGDRLGVAITNDGGEARAPSVLGTGLGNTRDRLASLYGESHRFEFGPVRSGGFEVRIELPYRVSHRDENHAPVSGSAISISESSVRRRTSTQADKV